MEEPPKTLKSQLITRNGGPYVPEERQQAGLPGASEIHPLPVLRAFQEFLDSERRRAKRRMIALAAALTLGVTLIAALGVFAAILVMSQYRADMRDVEADVVKMRNASMDLNSRTESALKRFSIDTAAIMSDLASQEETFSAARSEIGATKTAYEERISKMQEIVEVLQTENADLKAGLADLEAKLPLKPGDLPPSVASDNSRTPVVPADTQSLARAGSACVVSITSPLSDKPATFLLPIPE